MSNWDLSSLTQKDDSALVFKIAEGNTMKKPSQILVKPTVLNMVSVLEWYEVAWWWW